MVSLHNSSVGLAVAFWLFASAAVAQDEATRTADQVKACSRSNLPERTMAQALQITTMPRSGSGRTIDAVFFLKRFDNQDTRGTLQVRAPVDVSGVSYLWTDTGETDRLFLYLPTVQRVRRISGESAANSLLGSDFSYEDIKYLRGVSAGGETRKLENADIAGRPVHVLQVTPAPSEESAYSQVVFFIDQKTCVPIKIEFFESGDKLRKRLVADVDSLRQIGGRWLAQDINMHDLSEETQTQLQVEKAQFDDHINNAVFNQRGFYLGAYLQDSKE